MQISQDNAGGKGCRITEYNMHIRGLERGAHFVLSSSSSRRRFASMLRAVS